ncbi:NAD-dependent epimerase/dehydratase family protein [Paraburkholderia azotifigens]|uniref:NAD-dependent epimerase/dehydratase family protein n=1 Tax=Paraburkholderia azotifigens TaxID=2057004 RepID=UPI0038BB040D
MTHIAITGATGFIGRHVLAQGAAQGLDVVAVTRGLAPARQDNVRWVSLDIASPPDNAFDLLGRPDVLIHLAWGGLPNYRARRHFEVELPTHYAFLRQLVEAGLPSLVVAGTCLEYGLRDGALDETHPVAPVTPYGFAKDALRQQLEYLQRDHAFNLAWARLFYMHGDGQAPTSLLSQLRAAVERGDHSFAMSRGDQLRDYLSVTDVARNLVALATSGKNVGTVNVCSGTPRSVRGLVEQWLHDHDWNIQLELGRYPYPDYEPMAFWGTRTKLDRVLETL